MFGMWYWLRNVSAVELAEQCWCVLAEEQMLVVGYWQRNVVDVVLAMLYCIVVFVVWYLLGGIRCVVLRV